MKTKLLPATLLAVMVSLVMVNAVHADNPCVQKDLPGFGTLNPAAQQAAEIVGYGTCIKPPALYMNPASQMAAFVLGYGNESVPVY